MDWKTIFRIAIIYWVLWGIANWPGIYRAWWYADDFVNAESSFTDLLSHHAGLGRPLAGLWLASLRLDKPPAHELANIVLRGIQGFAHSLTAAIIAVLVGAPAEGLTLVGLGLPFLLWPFNADAVLWRTGSGHVWSALISMLGLALVLTHAREQISGNASIRKYLGVFLISLSLLVGQATPIAALSIYLMRLGRQGISGETIDPSEKYRNLRWILGGLIIGGLLSFAIGSWIGGSGGRVQLATNPGDKLFLLMRTHYNYWIRPLFNSRDIIFAHGLFLLFSAFATVLYFRKAYKTAGAFTALMLLWNPAVLSLSAFLMVRQNGMPWRGMYLMPLCICSGALLFRYSEKSSSWLAKIGIASVLIISLVYGWSSWKNAADYPQIMTMDVSLARDLEEWNSRNNPQMQQIALAIPEYSSLHDFNPYGLNYVYYDDKVPAFYHSYSADAFMRIFTRLRVVVDPGLIEQCRQLCRTGESVAWKRAYLSVFVRPQDSLLCGCIQ